MVTAFAILAMFILYFLLALFLCQWKPRIRSEIPAVTFFRVLQQNTNLDYDIIFSRPTHSESTSIAQKGNKRSQLFIFECHLHLSSIFIFFSCTSLHFLLTHLFPFSPRPPCPPLLLSVMVSNGPDNTAAAARGGRSEDKVSA